MIRNSRSVSIALGVVILLWQAGNAMRGRFLHPFLIADLVVGPGLIAAGCLRDDRVAAVAKLTAFSATAGVFLSAGTAAVLRDGYSLGRLLTGVGLIPCVVCGYTLARGLASRTASTISATSAIAPTPTSPQANRFD